MLAADIDFKVVSDPLGHSDTRVMRDIYQSVLPHVGKSAAEATAKLVPRGREGGAQGREEGEGQEKCGQGGQCWQGRQ